MTTAIEGAMQALATVVLGTGLAVWRGTDLPRDIPPAGLAELREGAITAAAMLSPLRWEVELDAELVVSITAGDEPTRDAALQAALAAVAAAIAADRTLGGAVDWAEPDGPQFDPLEIDGAAKSARLAVRLSFVTTDTILSPRAT